MVEAAAAPGEHEDALGAHRCRDVERELEIGRVLLGRMAVDPRPRGLSDVDRLRRRGVEVADGDRHLETERERVFETPVRGDDRHAGRHRRDRTSDSGGAPPDTTTTNSSDTPSSAGITQIRFCGSAAHQSALSARLARAPRLRSGHRSVAAQGPQRDQRKAGGHDLAR